MQSAETVGEEWLRLLKNRGVDCLFANSGTDFPSIIEGLARSNHLGIPVPRPVIAPHENAAVSMAHGYALVTGRAQAAMVHVNVGTANALNGLLNAERDYVPMILAAGRTPILETAARGARSLGIHWAQEMFDQASMVRETVRWDYELRHPSQLEVMTDRALALAHSVPRGPVYLTLPREVLAASPVGQAGSKSRMMPASTIAPDPTAVTSAAAALAAAQRPVIVTARAGADRTVPERLARLAEQLAAPVIEYRARHMNLSTDHPLHGGFEVGSWLREADVILVLDCDVPWIPGADRVHPDALVIQAGEDPLHGRYVIRGFAADITIMGSPALLVDALLAEVGGAACQRAMARRGAVEAACRARRAPALDLRFPPPRMSMEWASFCLDEVRAADSILVNEYPLVRSVMRVTLPGTFFGSSPAGGLGWGVPAGLGIKLAVSEREVIVAVGDGSYIFANPIACHQIALSERIPLLTVVFNNRSWGAVSRATKALYPEGYAARANTMPLTSLDPALPFAEIAAACGLFGRTVSDPAALPDALEEALAEVRGAQRGAVVDVLCDS